MINKKNLKRAWKMIKSPSFWYESKYISYYEKLPIDEHTILLESQHGAGASGNIYYLLCHLFNNPKYQNYRIYLTARKDVYNNTVDFLKTREIKDVIVVEHGSLYYYRLLATAKYIATDSSMNIHYIKKNGQVILSTWHGTPLKTLGKKSVNEFVGVGNVTRSFAMADYLLCPNQFTKNVFVEDYMLNNISCGNTVLCDYPRNSPFFNKKLGEQIRKELNLSEKKIYAFMPTFRGSASGRYRKIGTNKNDTYLNYYLYELDKKLGENEVLFLNLHPVVRKAISNSEFQHIKPFPKNYETYEFLSSVDCLITDYSSVFFDFAYTGKKIILFPYDLEEYMQTRGCYIDINNLPFPKVYDVDTLINELRSSKNYDDTAFLQKYCVNYGDNSIGKICDLWLQNKNSGNLVVEKIPDNGKDNVLIFGGDMARNGVTTSLRNLLSSVEHHKRNYIIAFYQEHVNSNYNNLFPTIDELPYIANLGDMNLPILARCIRKLFKHKLLSVKTYVKLNKKYIQYEIKRLYGDMRINTAIQFTGYGNEINLLYSQINANKVIFIHSDMENEICVRGNQRRDILHFCYNVFNKQAVVTEDTLPPTSRIKKTTEGIFTVRNLINVTEIKEKAILPIDYKDLKKTNMSEEDFYTFFASATSKFITIGRFSPEKNHEMLIRAFNKLIVDNNQDAKLVIVGGRDNMGYYQKTVDVVEELHLQNKVLLILNTPNPYAILNACNFFVLPSLYEGFGLVVAEADILGKPQICTNIPGPRSFFQEHGGTLVDLSIPALVQGMQDLLDGKIAPMNIDYATYNANALQEFERLFV